jgi:hypothetical protein
MRKHISTLLTAPILTKPFGGLHLAHVPQVVAETVCEEWDKMRVGIFDNL